MMQNNMEGESSQQANENAPQEISSPIQSAGSDAFSSKRDAMRAVYNDGSLIQSEKKLWIKKLENLPLEHYPDKARPKIPEITEIPVDCIVD